jgi:hypothetical protein
MPGEFKQVGLMGEIFLSGFERKIGEPARHPTQVQALQKLA